MSKYRSHSTFSLAWVAATAEANESPSRLATRVLPAPGRPPTVTMTKRNPRALDFDEARREPQGAHIAISGARGTHARGSFVLACALSGLVGKLRDAGARGLGLLRLDDRH